MGSGTADMVVAESKMGMEEICLWDLLVSKYVCGSRETKTGTLSSRIALKVILRGCACLAISPGV